MASLVEPRITGSNGTLQPRVGSTIGGSNPTVQPGTLWGDVTDSPNSRSRPSSPVSSNGSVIVPPSLAVSGKQVVPVRRPELVGNPFYMGRTRSSEFIPDNDIVVGELAGKGDKFAVYGEATRIVSNYLKETGGKFVRDPLYGPFWEYDYDDTVLTRVVRGLEAMDEGTMVIDKFVLPVKTKKGTNKNATNGKRVARPFGIGVDKLYVPSIGAKVNVNLNGGQKYVVTGRNKYSLTIQGDDVRIVEPVIGTGWQIRGVVQQHTVRFSK